HQQREKTHEKRIVDKIPLRPDPVLVNIDHVRQPVEGIKGNPYWKDHLKRPGVYLKAQIGQPLGKRFGEEIVILEHAEKTQIDRYAQPEPKPLHARSDRFSHLYPSIVVQHRRKYQQEQKTPVPAR